VAQEGTVRDAAQLQRALGVISACTRAALSARDETELVDAACRVVVDACGFRMAWIGYPEPDHKRTLRPVAHAGFEQGYLSLMRASCYGAGAVGDISAAAAVRTGRTSLTRNIESDLAYSPWRSAALERGYRSAASFPLLTDVGAVGGLNVYAAREDAFDESDLLLLTELANVTAFGIASRRAARGSRPEEERLRAALNAFEVSAFTQDRDLRYVWVAPDPPGEVLGRTDAELLPEAAARQLTELKRRVLSDGRPTRGEVRVEVPGRGTRDYELVLEPMRGANREITGVAGAALDVTQRKEAERRRNEDRERLGRMLNGMSSFIALLDIDGTMLDVNEAGLAAGGLTREQATGKRFQDMPVFDDPRCSRDAIVAAIARAARGEVVRADLPYGGPDGELRTADGTFSPVRWHGGRVAEVIASAIDVTERERARQQLRTSEERFRQLAENIREVFWMRDPAEGRVLYVSPAYEVIWGRTCQSLYDSPGDWLAAIHPDDRQWVAQAAVRGVDGGGYDHEYRIVRGDGTIAWIRDRAFPVRDAAGRLVSVVGVADDVTERRRLEEQIRQAQKMEAVGRLSAGIAHDFNNLLTVILGNGELTLSALPGGHEAGPFVTEIIQTAKLAATLTGQLLAFSRQQVVEPGVLDVGAIVAEAESMLVRLLGEAVQLEMVVGAPGSLVRANSGHLIQVLLNVAINARDAMPSGGRLSIEVSNLHVGEPEGALHPALSVGRYVVIRMSDTGTGMTPEVQAHLFEPFFTTKPATKGTGLGMSVVYGIVKQWGGGIEVDSELGGGTTVRIYLPAVEGAAVAVSEAPQPSEAGVAAESILVVEDDERVRRMVVAALARAGYRVIEAVDGTEAIRLLDSAGSNIDLCLSDVVMPGMGGREVAEHIRARHPGLRMLFMSGYTDDTVLLEGVVRADVPFLHKPFTPEELLEKIRQVLRGTRTVRLA